MTSSPRRVSTAQRLAQFKAGAGLYAVKPAAESYAAAVEAASRDAELLEEYTVRRRAVKLAADFHGVLSAQVLELVELRARNAAEWGDERHAWEQDPRTLFQDS